MPLSGPQKVLALVGLLCVAAALGVAAIPESTRMDLATAVVLYEGVLLAVVQFQRANVSLPARMDGILPRFIVTPAMHKIHHSRVQRETDSNYASLFSFWDRVSARLSGGRTRTKSSSASMDGMRGRSRR